MSDWPEMPPLDITATARAIAELWREELMKLERQTGEPIYWRIPVGTACVNDRIIEILMAYDEGRTRHLAFLKGELMRLHSRTEAH